MRILLCLMLAACVREPIDTSGLEPSITPLCEIRSVTEIDEPWLPVEGFGASVDDMTLAMMGEWRGQYQEVSGDYQPSTLHLYPSDSAAQRIEWSSESGPCGVEVVIPVDLFFDVPCLIYGDISTQVIMSAPRKGALASAKITAPRNLLDRPEYLAMLLTYGDISEGVMQFHLLWQGEADDDTQAAGSLFAALQ